MNTLFDFWQTDSSKAKRDTLRPAPSLNPPESRIFPQSQAFSSGGAPQQTDFWTKASGYVTSVSHFLGLPTATEMKDRYGKVEGTITASDIVKVNSSQKSIIGTTFNKIGASIKDKAEDFFKSGLFKILVVLIIGVIGFYYLKGYSTKRGAALA